MNGQDMRHTSFLRPNITIGVEKGQGRGNAPTDWERVGTARAIYFQSNLSYHIEQNRTSPKGGEEL